MSAALEKLVASASAKALFSIVDFARPTFTMMGLIVVMGIAAQAQAGAPCPPPGSPLTEAQRKFHPGHYVAIGRAQAPNGFKSSVLSTGIVGVQMRYRWGDLEPVQGQYDLSSIATDLDTATRAGVQLVAIIEDKSFDGVLPTPGYLQANYTVSNFNGGYTPLRRDAFVNGRLQQLVAQVASQFDCDSHFEGVAFQETALPRVLVHEFSGRKAGVHRRHCRGGGWFRSHHGRT